MGLFKVIERIGEVAYKLKFPTSSKIHPVFHVSWRKKEHGDYKVESALPSGLEDDREGEIEPELVLATRSIMKRGKRVNQWLVQWNGKNVDEATWEDELTLKSQFPEMSLEDKTLLQGEGVDRNQICNGPLEPLVHKMQKGPREWLVYSRRKKRGVEEE